MMILRKITLSCALGYNGRPNGVEKVQIEPIEYITLGPTLQPQDNFSWVPNRSLGPKKCKELMSSNTNSFAVSKNA